MKYNSSKKLSPIGRSSISSIRKIAICSPGCIDCIVGAEVLDSSFSSVGIKLV